MIKKKIFYFSLLLVLFSCEKKSNYIAEFSYSVNGETITIKGGGVSHSEWFTGETLKHVSYNTMGAGEAGKQGEISYMEQNYNFFLQDFTGGNKRHFDMQNFDEVYPYFILPYNGKDYYAISGKVVLVEVPNDKSEALKGIFNAVMVTPNPHFPSPTDTTETIVVTNGKFYYSKVSYGRGFYE